MSPRAAAARAARRLLTPTRPLAVVPRSVRLGLLLALAAQLGWHALQPPPAAEARELPPPPPAPVLRLTTLGEPATAAYAALLWLQLYDTQSGVSIPYRELDYARVRAWLEALLAVAPDSDYPLLLAVGVYGAVDDLERQRTMLELARAAFIERPAERWRWLAEAAIMARHRLGDPDLALRYARLLNALTGRGEIPHWARDLQLLLLQDVGEYEAVQTLIGGLLASGEIDDPHERRFLERQLDALRQPARDRDGGD